MTRPLEERRLVTILFADLSGFTTLSWTLDPEDVREVVNASFEALNEAVIQEGGVIHKYAGDLVIALFGLPAAHEDDPERAIRAGLRMMELIPGINETIGKKLKRKTALGLHAGINSGTVFVGEVGSSGKREYTIMGDAVNLTSRLKDAAGPGELIVSEPVFRASRYMFDYEPRPPVGLKGFAEPVKIFRPTAAKARSDPKRGIKGLLSPLVGRKEEMTAVRGAIERLSTGIGGAHAAIAQLFLDQGKNEQGLAHIEKAETVFRSMNEKRNLLDILRTKAELLMGSDAGRFQAPAQEALTLSAEIGSDLCLGNSHLTMGRVSLAVGDLSNAGRSLKAAVDLLVKVGQKKPKVDAWFEYGRFLKSQAMSTGSSGDDGEANVRKARQLYEEMGLSNMVARCVG